MLNSTGENLKYLKGGQDRISYTAYVMVYEILMIAQIEFHQLSRDFDKKIYKARKKSLKVKNFDSKALREFNKIGLQNVHTS